MGGAIHRFHAGVGEVRRFVGGAQHQRAVRGRVTHVAVVARRRVGVGRCGIQLFAHVLRRQGGQCPEVPLHLERIAAAFRRPIAVGEHRHAVGNGQHSAHARYRPCCSFIEAGGFGAGQWRARHHSDQQAAHLGIDAVLRAAVHFLRRVEPLHGSAQQPEFGLGLQPGRSRNRQFRGAANQRAVRQPSAIRPKHLALLGAQQSGVEFPMRRCCRHQHLARRRAGLAQRHPVGADRGAAAGGLQAKHRVVVGLVHGCRLDADAVPVGVELFGNQHRNRGQHTLAHLGRPAQHGDAVVGCDAQPGIRRKRRCVRQDRFAQPRRFDGQGEADHERRAGAAFQEGTPRARAAGSGEHRHTPRTCRFAAASLIAARIWL